MRKNIGRIGFVAVVGLLGLGGCDDGDADGVGGAGGSGGTGGTGGQVGASLFEVLEEDGRFTTLVSALEGTGLDQTLHEPLFGQSFTVFAPTDAAFELLPQGLVEGLNQTALTEILRYHVHQGTLERDDVRKRTTVFTMANDSIDVSQSQEMLILDGRAVLGETTLRAEGGIIHVIDAVLVPGEFPGTVADVLGSAPRFSTLRDAANEAGLAGALADPNQTLTVFAPTDAGFARLPQGLVDGLEPQRLTEIVSYHVLPQEVSGSDARVLAVGPDPTAENLFTGNPSTLQVDGADVILNGRAIVEYTDIQAQNGVVHVLDSVLIPGTFPGTIIQALQAYPRFETLAESIGEAGLEAALNGMNGGAGFTVFAPTHRAFGAVDLDGLTPTGLADVLRYHVTEEQVVADELVQMSSVSTLEGGDITVEATEDQVLLNETAEVTWTDVLATNGVIHVIDEVLSPGG